MVNDFAHTLPVVFLATALTLFMFAPTNRCFSSFRKPHRIVVRFSAIGIVLAVLGGLSSVAHADGTTWETQTSATDNNWFSVTWGGLTGQEKFVAVSSSGSGNRVMTSPNGTTWTTQTSIPDITWFSVTWGGPTGQEKFVAVGAISIFSGTPPVAGFLGQVMTSPDGITWTSRTSIPANDWRSVTWGNGLFVAVSASGTGNRVMTSPDGITWTTQTSAADNNWASVTWGGPTGQEKFVAVSGSGTGNRVMTSGGAPTTPPTTAASTAPAATSATTEAPTTTVESTTTTTTVAVATRTPAIKNVTKDASLPETGDNSSMNMLIGLLVVLTGFVLVGRRRVSR